MFGIPSYEIVMMAAAMLGAGAVTGLLAGVFGVGGGSIMVPVLYEFFRLLGVPDEVRMPLCIGTSLAIIAPTSVRSFRAHHKKGVVDLTILKIWAVPVVAGVVVGGFIASFASENLFKTVFVVVSGISALKLLTARESWRFGNDLPGRAAMLVYGLVIGLLSALMGVGGGLLSSMFMTFYGRPIHQAVATSSGLGPLIAIPGVISYVLAGWGKASLYPDVTLLQMPYALGFVSLLGLVLLFPASMLTAPVGARLAHALPRRKLEVAFGIFMLVVSARFLWSMFNP
ncbi:sulfite exporter TauE/SafE family protein [Aquamicrobium terrae]